MGNTQKRRGLAAYSPIAVILGLGLICLIFVGLFAFTPANYISATEVSSQNVSGVPATNYMPILKDDVEWDSLSEKERADIARHAVVAAIEKAGQDGITTFNVMGLSNVKDQPVFLYSGGSELSIYVGGEATTIPLKE